METPRRYSGDRSRQFWARVDAANDDDLYWRACRLQELEDELLRDLDAPGEPQGKRPKGMKRSTWRRATA